tara:strand:+ start:493 stop:708 length:216 start_codon:yes stop_codon:yes gene_type:complete
MVNTFYKLKISNPELTIESLRGFINTHYIELTTNPDCNVVQLYKDWAEVNLGGMFIAHDEFMKEVQQIENT